MVNVEWSKTSTVIKIFIKFEVSAATTVKHHEVKKQYGLILEAWDSGLMCEPRLVSQSEAKQRPLLRVHGFRAVLETSKLNKT